MQKAAAVTVMLIGIAILVAALAILTGSRLSLPPQTEQTEDLWMAYTIHKWAFLLGELPLSLAVCLLGYLLSPSRLVGRPLSQVLAAVAAVVGLASLGAMVFVVQGAFQQQEPFSFAPWLGLQGGVLMGILAVLAALAVRKLVWPEGEALAGTRERAGAEGG